MKLKFRIVILSVVAMMALCCAQIGRPQGGEDDTESPTVLAGESTPNAQTRFSDKKIELAFSEFISVSNTAKEVFISPPLDYPILFTDRGKKLTLEFNEEEVLKENTTYQINFGKAIKDLTAGNVLENYTFLFSTGDKLDELEVTGKVVDAQTNQGMADVLVLLHDNLSDTSFTTLKPTYLTRTDEDGAFKLQNLRADTFQIYALKDENVSYTYDIQSEQVAYLDSFLILKEADTVALDLVLELFDEEDKPRYIEARQRQAGLVKIVYSPVPRNPKVRMIASTSGKTFTELAKDTIYFWHDTLEADSLVLELSYDGQIDTMKVRSSKKSIKETALASKIESLSIKSTDTIKVEWNKPLMKVDTTLISLTDTSMSYPITASGIQGKTMWLLSNLASDAEYQLVIDSSAVQDWYDVHNKDSLSVSVTTIDPTTLGSIKLIYAKTDTINYLVDLVYNGTILEKETITDTVDKTYNQMSPGKYSLEIIQDTNGDGRWSSGSLKEKRRPELKEQVSLETLKAGWDLETEVDLTELFYGTKSE